MGLLKNRLVLGNRLRLVQQVYSNDCGIACLKMIADFYGQSKPLSQLRVLADLDQEGMSIYDLNLLAAELGFEGLPVEMNIQELYEHQNDLTFPAILHWQENHFVVLESIKSGSFTILDPALGKLSLTADEFSNHWLNETGKGRMLLLTKSLSFSKQNNTSVQSGSSLVQILQDVKRHLMPHKGMIFRAVWSMLFILLMQLLLPFIMQSFIDTGIESQNFSAAIIIMSAFIVFSSSTLILQWFQNWMLLFIGSRLRVGLLYDFINGIARLPGRFFDKNFPADLMQRFGDHIRIEAFVRDLSLRGVLVVISLLGFGVILSFYNLWLMLIFLLFSSLSTWLIIAYLPKRKMLDNQSFNLASEEQELLWEYVSHVDTVRMNRYTHKLRLNWLKYQEDHLKLDKAQLKLSMVQEGGASFINLLRDTIISLFAAYLVIQGEMSLGSLIAIQFIVAQLNVSFQHVPALISSAQDAFLSAERIENVKVFESSSDGDQSINAFNSLEVKDLSFLYKPGNNWELKGIDFSIGKDAFVAIAGVSGCGKTTLLKLLAKKYEGYNGSILLNDKNELKSIAKDSFWELTAYAQADDPVFSTSILENILMGRSLDTAWLKTCLELVEMLEFVEDLPNHVQTKLGEQGINLSLGQQQRILLARLIYTKPSLVFVDEIPNALSEAQTLRIIKKIRLALPGLTMVMCTHSKNLVYYADKVLHMHGGEVVDQGKGPELERRSLSFRNLFTE